MKHDCRSESNSAQYAAVGVTLMVVFSTVGFQFGIGRSVGEREAAVQRFLGAAEYGTRLSGEPHVRITLAGESSNVFRSVTNGTVGFSETANDGFWVRHRNDDGLVSLAGLPDGKHWLISGSSNGRAVFAVTLPEGKSIIEAQLRVMPARGGYSDGRSTFEPSSPRVELSSDDVETIVVDVRNYGDDTLKLFDSDVTLVLQKQSLRVYSPEVVANPATDVAPLDGAGSTADKTEPLVAIPAGESRSIRIHWPLWVSRGIWTSRMGELIREPAFPDAEPGKVQVRVDVLNYGTGPVQLTEPGGVMKKLLVAISGSDTTKTETQ